jgi:hypothetical protein
VAEKVKDIAVPGSFALSGAGAFPVAEKAKDVAVPGSSAAALCGAGPAGAAAEKDVAAPASSAFASSGPAPVSHGGVPLPKQQTTGATGTFICNVTDVTLLAHDHGPLEP